MLFNKKYTLKEIIIGLIAVTSIGVQALEFDSKKDEIIFSLVSVGNDLFLKTTNESSNIFASPINYSRWNSILGEVNKYVQQNAKDAIGRKDNAILDSFNKVIEANNQVMSTIRQVYDNYIGVKNQTYTGVKKGEEIIYTLNTTRKKFEDEMRNASLQKLMTGRTTLGRKKDAIEVIMRLADILGKICTKAVNDYFKISRKVDVPA